MRREDADDAGLLLAAASGDDRAFAAFYRRWLPVVTGYHLRRTSSRELAFDLTAETFAAVVIGLARFDPERGSAPGWLFEIAEHKLLDSVRRARVERVARARLGFEPVVLEDRDLENIRLARVVNGTSFYLFPVGNLGRRPIPPAAADRCYRLLVATLRTQLPKIPPAKRAVTLRNGTSEFASARRNLVNARVYEGVFLLDAQAIGGGGGGLASISEIQEKGMLGGGGGGKPHSPIVMDGIVPAGVTTVTLQFPASRHYNRRLPALSATGDVVNNVFVIPVPTLFERGGWPTTAIWRSASGKIIKTIDETQSHP